MEFSAYLAGEPHSDHPDCVSPVLIDFCIAFNNALDDVERQKLHQYLARTIGTRGDGRDEERAWLATDWLIRTYVPAWLTLAALDDMAERLRSLPPVLAAEDLQRAMVDLTDARRQAHAAWDAAAGGNAKTAAWIAAGTAARIAGRVVARVTAGDAVRLAAWATTGANVAGAVLRPTACELQRSAFDLLDRMLPTEGQTPSLEYDATSAATPGHGR